MSNNSGKKFNLNAYKKSYNNNNSKHRQNFKNPESNGQVLGRIKNLNFNVDDKDLLPADNNFNYQNIYIISNDPDFVDNKVFDIARQEFELRDYYSFANIALPEFKQVYKFGYKTDEELELMLKTPKVAVTSQNQTFIHKGKPLHSYKIFLIAPELYSNNAPELKHKNLPVIYALDIMYRIDCPKMFRITFQAIVGGCGDGLFNLIVLDNNEFEDDFEHKLLGPHIHSRSNKNFKLIKLHKDKQVDTLGSDCDNLEGALEYILDKINFNHSMVRTLRNEKVKDICESLVNKDGYLKTPSEAPIKKITAKTIIKSKEAYEKDKATYQKTRVICDFYVLMDDNGKFKSVNSITAQPKKVGRPKKQKPEGMGEN